MSDVISWSWEGPENPYWIGTHSSGITVGVIEYCEDFPAGSHWYFSMDPANTFGVRTMAEVTRKMLELESGMERISESVVSGFEALMETEEMKSFFGSATTNQVVGKVSQ